MAWLAPMRVPDTMPVIEIQAPSWHQMQPLTHHCFVQPHSAPGNDAGQDALCLLGILDDVDDMTPVKGRQRIIGGVQPSCHHGQRQEGCGLAHTVGAGNGGHAMADEARDDPLRRPRQQIAIKKHGQRVLTDLSRLRVNRVHCPLPCTFLINSGSHLSTMVQHNMRYPCIECSVQGVTSVI